MKQDVSISVKLIGSIYVSYIWVKMLLLRFESPKFSELYITQQGRLEISKSFIVRYRIDYLDYN